MGRELNATSIVHVLGVHTSLNGRSWLWRDQAAERLGLGLAQRLDLPEIIGRLLATRGIDHDTAAHFLAPTLRALLPDPHTLIDMEAAANRLARAVNAGETVAVFGDYDVDGACAGAIMATTLRALGCIVLSYVPDRMREGYGPNHAALESLAARGATLIVCVDCGSAAHVPLSAMRGRAELLVLDHHACEGPPPPVLATVNPNRLDCGSGMGHLCAAGVTFLTAVATHRVLRRAGFFAQRREPDLLGLLDLVALATVCDVMPLIGLNRAFVVQGLRVLARRERPGLAALLEVAQARGLPDAHTLGFALGPRINAAGRISEADLGLRLLLCDDPVEAASLAAQLDGINGQRQFVEQSMLDAAMAQAEAQLAAGHAVVMVAGEGWHPGVVGIVAGRIKERFNRPALVAGIADGMAKGSARSVPGHDLGAAIIAARQAGLLHTGGGHAMAAGFGLPAAGIAALHGFVDERLASAALLPRAADLLVEGTLAAEACTTETAGHLARLAPYGHGNTEPLMVLPRMRVVHAERIGREAATIRAMLAGEAAGPRVKALMFRAKGGPLADALLARDGAPLHLAGHLRAEEWNGNHHRELLPGRRGNRLRRAALVAALLLGAAAPTSLDAMLAAYPGRLTRAGDALLWPDGTRFAFSAEQPAPIYPRTLPPAEPLPGEDPGRDRDIGFLTHMYGDCRLGEVEPRLVSTPWVGGHAVRITSVNHADRHLAAVARELDSPEWRRYLWPIAGTYVCRTVADTGAPSMHAFGAAIDINISASDYWLWRHGAPWRDRVPDPIVAAFERHGFIWGGRWAHYDTMHFEYRPELLGQSADDPD